jgi:hypothetical protein
LFDPANPANTWSLGGTVEFHFPVGQMIPAAASLVLVGFNPQTDPVSFARFRSRYGFDSATILGPWRGRLNRQDGLVQLSKPGKPASPGPGLVTVPQVLVEQVSYAFTPSNEDALPAAFSLQRRDTSLFADDPANWSLALPSPGGDDRDGDGLSDFWEAAQGLNHTSSTGTDGTEGDPDGDGMPNLWEFKSGTDPLDPASRLALEAMIHENGAILLSFPSIPGRSYTVEYRDHLAVGEWKTLGSFLSGESERVTVSDTPNAAQRWYRLILP